VSSGGHHCHCRGGFRTRPYQIIHNQDNPVHVVGHDHKRIQFNVRVMVGQIVPCPDNDLPKWIHPHLALHHLAKQTFATLRANGDKIRPRLGIIVSLQTDAAAVVFIRVVRHGSDFVYVQPNRDRAHRDRLAQWRRRYHRGDHSCWNCGDGRGGFGTRPYNFDCSIHIPSLHAPCLL